MPKTNKELLDQISKEMKISHEEKEKNLEYIKKSEYSDGLKKQMREEIMNNFYAKMDEFKEREGYDDAIKSARQEKLLEGKLRKIDKERDEIQESLKQAQVAHRGKVEEQNALEKMEIPPELAKIRKKWEENIDLPDDKKKAIIEAVNRIQKGAKEESDGSISVTFELGGKIYESLDVNLEEHSDGGYIIPCDYGWKIKQQVKLKGMQGDDTSKWENEKLAKYVEDQKNDENRRLEIPTIELRRKLLKKLGKEAGLTEESDQIAMWMYLTGSEGWYWGTMGDDKKSNSKARSRSNLLCYDSRFFDYFNGYDDFYASLCLIACL